MTDWTEYDGFLAEADKEVRIGDHEAIVNSTLFDKWGEEWGGGNRYKISFNLTDVGGRVDATLGDLPSAGEMEAAKSGSNRSKVKGLAANITMLRQLDEHYNVKSVTDIKEGMKFRVKVAPNQKNPNFPRVIAFLPPAGAGSADSSNEPF